MIRTEDFSRSEAGELVQSCFADLIREVDAYGGFIPSSSEPDLEIREQQEMSRERIADLRGQLASAKFDASVKARAAQILSSRSLTLAQVPAARQIDLLSGVARALVEQQWLFLVRTEDRLSDAQPHDALFHGCRREALSIAAPSFEAVPSAVRGPTAGEAIKLYLGAGQKRWVRKTFMARSWQLRYLEEHLGAGTPLASVTSHDIRSFRDGILALRANHGKTRSQSFVEKQTENPKKRIVGKTAALIFEPTKAFLRWCEEDEGMIPSSPAKGVRLVTEAKPKGEKSRRPFTKEELEKLFSAPVFTGYQSVHRRYAPGNKVIWDAKFWVPVLAFYTGARMGELVQLHISDIELEGALPLMSINDDNTGSSATERKHLKSAAAIRRIPLHPDIMQPGFGKFIASRRNMRKRSARLFPDVPYGSDGQASTVFSKWFARFLDKAGLSDPTLVFHSFRHNAEDAFRDALQPQYVIDRIIGHSDGATSAGYGDGVSLETAYAAVKAMKFKVCVTEVLHCA